MNSEFVGIGAVRGGENGPTVVMKNQLSESTRCILNSALSKFFTLVFFVRNISVHCQIFVKDVRCICEQTVAYLIKIVILGVLKPYRNVTTDISVTNNRVCCHWKHSFRSLKGQLGENMMYFIVEITG